MKNQRGFSLIELLIVVLIIAIIAAIAIPNFMAARRAANESSTISNLRTLHGAEMVYSKTTGGGLYTSNFNDLVNAKIVDSSLGSGYKSGYLYAVKADPTAKVSFTLGAVPQVASGAMQSGTRRVCITVQGVVRFNNDPAMIGTNIENDGDCNETNYVEIIQ